MGNGWACARNRVHVPLATAATITQAAVIPMVECVGCGQDFSVKGYTHHITKTSHQPCISSFEVEVRRIEASLQDASDGAHRQPNEDMVGCNNTLPFDDEALDWEDDDSEVEESDTEPDEDGVDIIGELQELPNQPDIPEQERCMTPVGDARNLQDQPTVPDTYPIDDGDWTFEIYPLDSAGTPLATTDSFAKDDEESRRNVSADDIYGPFESRMDWELARWAKYETISSNALTRLLSIDGVSDLMCHIENLANQII